MRRFVVLSLVLLCTFSVTAETAAGEFTPKKYQIADGAIVLQPNNYYVEPYFATKALIAAQDAGLDVRHAGLAWINWALPHQKSDGRFDRYCRKQDGQWHSCGAADADDSMLALWLQLLYRLSPNTGLPAEWQQSAKKAREQLDKLRNGRLGIYHVSSRNHVALFMDNVEVYSALRDIAQAQARFGDQQGAQATTTDAEKLASAIQHVFWDKHNHWFKPSMQKSSPAFYPDVVAQVFPWIENMPTPQPDARAAWTDWKNRFASAWISNKYDPHPWGLVALAAMKVGDESSVLCWLSHAEPLRNGAHWNVLEEAVFQGLQQTVQTQQANVSPACKGVAGAP
jgi:mannosylglycerate hydrolase MGH1-like protein